MSQCTATSKRSGEQCRDHAMKGRDVCYHHGGKSPRGIASATFKTGGYSIDLPTRLQTRYEHSANDPQLLDLTADLALNRAFMQDALSGLDSGESGRLWKALHATWDDLQAANRAKDGDAAKQALNEIGSLIKHGYGASTARDEAVDLSERRRKLVESEQKRRVAMQDMVTTGQVMLFIAQLQQAVQRHVHDADTLAAIADELGRLTA